MKKLFFSLCAVAILALGACDKYDDGPLTNRVDNLEQRVSALETLCKQINTNIASLQTLVGAMNQSDVITSITPLKEGNEVVGYTITFSKSPAINIYNGKDGQDATGGNVPVVGLEKDADGHYYWTLNGEWMLDAAGHKIPAEGKQGAAGNDGADGKDGITPQFKIENGDWYISLDNGQSWDYMGRATGADGANGTGGDSMFSSIDTSNPESVTFTLSNGTSFTLARVAELAITFDQDGLLAMNPGTTRTIAYTVTGNTDGLKVEVLTSGNVRAKLSEGSAATGSIIITTGATVTEYDKVILLASNGSTTVMSSISFQESDCLIVTGETSYSVNAAGGTIAINIETNTDYTLSIPTAAQSWISVDGSRAMRQEIITLNIATNDGASRAATLALIDKDGNPLANILISQAGNASSSTIPSNMEEAFPDMFFRAYVLEHFDTDDDNIISQEEADKVDRIEINNQKVTSLQGIQYFPNLSYLDCISTKITSLDLSHNLNLRWVRCRANYELTNMGISACVNLEYLECSDSHKLAHLDISNFKKLAFLDCSFNGLTSLNVSKNTELTVLYCDYNDLTSLDVSNNTALTRFSCYYNNLTILDVSTNTNLIFLSCGWNQLKSLDVSKTNLGNSTEQYPLICGHQFDNKVEQPRNTLSTLYLKAGWSINGITENRYNEYIPEGTEIIYVD